MKNYKHSKEWYIRVHNILAGVGLIFGSITFFIICGLLEAI